MDLVKMTAEPETNLHYQLAYRLVGEPEWLKHKKYRDGLVKRLMELSVETSSDVSHVMVVNIGLAFQIEINRRQNLNRMVNYFGLQLARYLDKLAPELQLDRLVQGRSISSIWHRPYLVRTVTPSSGMTVNRYLELDKMQKVK